MPPERHVGARRAHAPAIELPPPFQLVMLREVGDAFDHAVENAADLGAGSLVCVGRFDLAEFALVLEPDEPLRTARRAFYAGMAALADALAAHAPPEKPLAIDWPDAIRVDGGLVGGGRLAWAETPEGQRPDWLVFGAMIRTVAIGEGEPGLRPLAAALEDEGFDEAGSERLAESFARHFMLAVDAWQEQGFNAVSKAYLQYLARESGVRREITEEGDLLIRRVGKAELKRRALLPVLSSPTWFDPQKRGPR